MLLRYPAAVRAAVEVLNVKVLDKTKTGDPQNIRKGMQWAVDHGADVLAMALGVPQALDPELCDFADELIAKTHVAIFAAAGNDPSFPMCPARGKDVISSAAIGMEGKTPASMYAPGVISFVPIGAPFASPEELAKNSPELAKDTARKHLNRFNSVYEYAGVEALLKLSEECVRLADALDDPKLRARALFNRGLALQHAGDDLEAAEQAFSQARQSFQRDGDKESEELALHNLALLQQQEGKLEASLANWRTLTNIAHDLANPRRETDALFGICSVQFKLGQHTEAFESCNLALKQARNRRFTDIEAMVSYDLGAMYRWSKNNAKAVHYLNRAHELFIEVGNHQGLDKVDQELISIKNIKPSP